MSRARGAGAKPRPLDDIDREMLVLLRDDARISLTAIGRVLHLGAAAVHERVRRLQQVGYIEGFHTRLNYTQLDLGLAAFVGLQTQQSTPLRERLAEALRAMPEVEEFSWVTGDFDALLKVRARDTGHLQQVLFRVTRAGEGQVRARTMVILSQPFCKPGPDFEAVTETDRTGVQPGQRYPAAQKSPAPIMAGQKTPAPKTLAQKMPNSRSAAAAHPLGNGVLLPP
jgi:DNA-binding Lrp family transcriptional regulator